MNNISIQQEYSGTTYRSRTEARWAVLMDAAGVGFQYEPEGYALVSGWYVPDFWVSGLNAFLEVKPEDLEIGPGHYIRERFLAEDLASLKKKPVLVACGWPHDEMNLVYFEPDRIMPELRPISDFFRADQIHHAKSYRFDWATPERARQARDHIRGAARRLTDW
jgi:hypothetical protein